jgi:DNA-binding GntR family transcriptional regulator
MDDEDELRRPAAARPAAGTPSPASRTTEIAATLTEEAYRRLEEMIVTLELAPGSVVSEAILGRQLGIGTTPIREALQRLSREHLVQILPRRGVVVTTVDLQQQLQVLETRRELDRLIARAAARRATAPERAVIVEIAARLERAAGQEDIRGFMRLDGELRRAMARAARNEIAAAAVATLHAVSRRFWFFHHGGPAELAETARLHATVARAVAAADEAAAAEASDQLIAHLVAFARGTLLGLEAGMPLA